MLHFYTLPLPTLNFNTLTPLLLHANSPFHGSFQIIWVTYNVGATTHSNIIFEKKKKYCNGIMQRKVQHYRMYIKRLLNPTSGLTLQNTCSIFLTPCAKYDKFFCICLLKYLFIVCLSVCQFVKLSYCVLLFDCSHKCMLSCIFNRVCVYISTYQFFFIWHPENNW